MNRRIIIENRSKASLDDVFEAVKVVIDSGRISNNGKQYCYLTTFSIGRNGAKDIAISTDCNKMSDRFIAVDL